MGLILDCSEQRPQIKYEICHEITNEQHYIPEISNNKLSSISNRTNNYNNEINKSKRYLKLYNSKIKNEDENINEKLSNKKQNDIIDSFQKNNVSDDDIKRNKNNFFRNSNREISSILNLGSNNYLDDSSLKIEFTNEKFNQFKQKNKNISNNNTPQFKKNLLRNNSLSKLSTSSNRKKNSDNFNEKKNINKDLLIKKMIFVENKIKNKNFNSKYFYIKPISNRTPSPKNKINFKKNKNNKNNLNKFIINNNENSKLKKSSSFSEKKNFKINNNKLNNYNNIFKNNFNENENNFIKIPIKYKYSKVNENLIYNDENENKYIKLSYMILNSINTDYIIYDGIIYKVQRTKINGFKLIEKYFQLTKNQFKYFNSIYSSQVYNNLPLVQFDIRNIINIEVTDKDYLLNFINLENSSNFVFTIILNNNEYFIFSTENDEFGNNIITIINLLRKYYSFFKSNS